MNRAQETGEDDPDILFLYGKALFQVAQKNSQVLGGAPASDPAFGIPLDTYKANNRPSEGGGIGSSVSIGTGNET